MVNFFKNSIAAAKNSIAAVAKYATNNFKGNCDKYQKYGSIIDLLKLSDEKKYLLVKKKLNNYSRFVDNDCYIVSFWGIDNFNHYTFKKENGEKIELHEDMFTSNHKSIYYSIYDYVTVDKKIDVKNFDKLERKKLLLIEFEKHDYDLNYEQVESYFVEYSKNYIETQYEFRIPKKGIYPIKKTQMENITFIIDNNEIKDIDDRHLNKEIIIKKDNKTFEGKLIKIKKIPQIIFKIKKEEENEKSKNIDTENKKSENIDIEDIDIHIHIDIDEFVDNSKNYFETLKKHYYSLYEYNDEEYKINPTEGGKKRKTSKKPNSKKQRKTRNHKNNRKK